MKVRDIIREIEQAGWYQVRQTGSHRQFHHPTHKGTEVNVIVRPSVQVVLEGDDDGWSAYVPSVPGCHAAAKTREEVIKLIEEAPTLHLQDLHETELREIEREASEVEAAERRA